MILDEWLTHIESQHYSEIELGLDRIAAVYTAMFPQGVPYEVITVGGTNGKGSCCAYLESIFSENGQKVGKYTSPHIVQFNERIAVNQKEASDKELCNAFECIEKVRGEILLTYFEYATLAAIYIFAEQKVAIAIFEVGLGGRLDAVNILSPQVSVVTSIGLDHVDWLGDDICVIAEEKAAIARKDKVCVVGQIPNEAQQRLFTKLQDIGAKPIFALNELIHKSVTSWSLENVIEGLPLLSSHVTHQYSNAACAILAAVNSSFKIETNSIIKGLNNTKVVGRCQIVRQHPITVLDVAHNYDSVVGLKEFVASLDYSGKCYAVFSMLSDKDIGACIHELSTLIDEWHIAEIADITRAVSIKKLKSEFSINNISDVYAYKSLENAYQKVNSFVTKGDCILIFGSFHVVGELHDVILRS